MNEDIFGHDPTSDMASTPNAAELNAALPQLLSTSTIAFDAFDDLDINQTNFSELDEEEQDIAHIILSDPSLLGLDCLVGAGPPKNRAHGVATSEQEFALPESDIQVASTSRSRASPADPFASGAFPSFDFTQLPPSNPVNGNSEAAQDGGPGASQTTGGAVQTNEISSIYGHRPLSRAAPTGSLGRPTGEDNGIQRGTHTSMGSRIGSRSGSPPKPPKPPTMRKACDLCHQAKQKCSGERPTCERCKVGGWPCHYAVRQKRRTPATSATSVTPVPQSHSITGGIKAPPTFRSVPIGTSMAPRPVQCQRPIPLSNTNGGPSARPQNVAPASHQKVAARSVLPPPPPLLNQQSGNSTSAPTPANSIDTKQTSNSSAPAAQPRFRSIAGPIKAGMPNFGQFSANAFLAKKFPGLMPGASRPIVSPGQLPYTSKAAALSGVNQETVSSPNQQNRPTKKRKTKNGGGVASAEVENDLNVMDGFGYLYGFQDTGSSNPEPVNHGYHGPVGWAPSLGSDQIPGSTPRDEQVLTDRWHASMRMEGEPDLRPEEYLQIIREDGLLADLDFERHLLTLAPMAIDPASHQDFSPSHTQTSDDVLQDVASILDPQFTHQSGASAPVKAENTDARGTNGVASHPFSDFADADEEVLRLIRQEFGHSAFDTTSDAQQNTSTVTDIKSSGDGSMADLDAGMLGDNDHVNAANLAAYGDQVFGATFSSHDSHRSEASSVYHDSGEARLPDFMMEDLTDFAAWSAQAEQPLAPSQATSQFGTNPQPSPIIPFQNPHDSGIAVDAAGLDDLIQLNVKREEEQFALDLASMFPDPEEIPQQVNQSSATEDIIMDGGSMNIAELDHALQQHADMTNTPVAGGQDALPSPDLLPKVEELDTPLSTSHIALPGIDALDESQGQYRDTPVSQANTPTPGFADPPRLACQHEVDISQTVRALSHLGQPTTALGQLMPHLTRALETLVSLHVCSLCAVNPSQTIPQLALLSRTCSILMRPHPLTPSPLPLVIAGGRTTFTGLAPEIEVHIIDILWANWRSHSLQKVFLDLGRRVHQHANECARKRHEQRKNMPPSADGEHMNDGPTPEELRCDMMTLALKRFRTKIR